MKSASPSPVESRTLRRSSETLVTRGGDWNESACACACASALRCCTGDAPPTVGGALMAVSSELPFPALGASSGLCFAAYSLLLAASELFQLAHSP